MAHGLLDYYRGINVAYQALSEMIIRPKYGAALLASGSMEVVANSHNTLAIVSGKGMTYGGAVWLDYTLSQANGEVEIMPDDLVLSGLSFYRLMEYGILRPRTWPVSLNVYDSTNRIYSAGISYGITFETTLELAYQENNGFTPTVHYRLAYALI